MNIVEIAPKPKEQKTIRIAAYARVSSDKDAAFNSLAAKEDYYKRYVVGQSGWELVGLYSDNGISGTTAERPDFQRLLTDCRNGKIDLVITKSVTRFARNIVTLLGTIRELKALGIDIFFEKENMHSISSDGELFLTLLGLFAEEEARSASENQKWRIRKRFEQGLPWVGDMLGYRLIDGEMIIIPEEAELVRKIFDYYLSGMGRGEIAKALMSENIQPMYCDIWRSNTIAKILKNEKYTGDMLLQKTYRPDFRTKKDKLNTGQVRQFYVEDSHERIISKEIFAAVQEEIARRQKKYHTPKNPDHKNLKLFTGKIFCEKCGKYYIHKYTNAKKYDKAVWKCFTYNFLSKRGCDAPTIPEAILIEKAKEILGKEHLTKEVIQDSIDRILVKGKNLLVFELSDGSKKTITWEHPSRARSWTPEMKAAAREKTLKYHAERRKHEQPAKSDSD